MRICDNVSYIRRCYYLSQLELIIIVIKIDNVLATRSRAIYLDRRPYRATLILSNLLSVLLRPSLGVVL